MAAIALALGASLTWGLADFFGALKGRSLGALRALFYVQLSGLATIAIVVAVRGKGPADSAVLLAVPAGISGTLGLYAFYRGVAGGGLGLLSPIAGLSGGRADGGGGRGGGRPPTRPAPRGRRRAPGGFPS